MKLIFFLIRFYIANSRSIIFIVVLIKNDYVNQIVIKFTRDVDLKGV